MELAKSAEANRSLLDPRGEAALVEALKLLHLRRLKLSGRELTSANESALLALVTAKLQVIDRHDKSRRNDNRFSEIQFLRFAGILQDILTRHIHDPSLLRAISDDIGKEHSKIGIILGRYKLDEN